jgi:hypothetical protein
VHVLEDGEAGHEPRGQRRTARDVGVDGAEALIEKAPVNGLAELGQRMARVDDLVEPRAKQIPLPAVSALLRPHDESPCRSSFGAENHAFGARSICKKNAASSPKSGENDDFRAAVTLAMTEAYEFFTGDY